MPTPPHPFDVSQSALRFRPNDPSHLQDLLAIEKALEGVHALEAQIGVGVALFGSAQLIEKQLRRKQNRLLCILEDITSALHLDLHLLRQCDRHSDFAAYELGRIAAQLAASAAVRALFF